MPRIRTPKGCNVIRGWPNGILPRLCVHALLFVVALGPTFASAQEAGKLDRLEQAWRGWVAANDLTRATVAFTYRGAVQGSFGHGVPADHPMEMASLSKAITAICIDGLVQEGMLAYDQPLSELLPQMPPALADMALQNLIAQDGGLGPDSTQETMWRWLDDETPHHAEVTANALSRDAQEGTPGTYLYNNENYAILGEIIATLTGQSYRDYCGDTVLPTDAYPTADVSHRAAAFDAWGGWAMSAADYARFHAASFGSGSAIAAVPEAYPHVSVGGGAYYGMGTLWRHFRGDVNFWHFGAQCFDGFGAGSYAVSWQGQWGVMAAWDRCLPFDNMVELDQLLVRAVFAD